MTGCRSTRTCACSRSRYEQIAALQQDFPLGHAVAASACVPALFHPLAVSGLFPGVRVELVDGGVHDNQGVGGLLDLDCRRMIVSDASGQMADIPDPSTRIPAAAGRASSIYGDRVREEQLIESMARPGTVLMHLRKGLAGPGSLAVRRRRGADRADERARRRSTTRSRPPVQDRLAQVRTDLDSFSEVEAYSLSLYGYLMTSVELPEAAASHLRVGAWTRATSTPCVSRCASPERRTCVSSSSSAKRFRQGLGAERTHARARGVAALVVLAVVGFLVYLLSGPATEDVPAWTLIVARRRPCACSSAST